MDRRSILKTLEELGIEGMVTGAGRSLEVEVPCDADKDKLIEKVPELGGFRTGYGSWILSSCYKAPGEWNDRSSQWHY